MRSALFGRQFYVNSLLFSVKIWKKLYNNGKMETITRNKSYKSVIILEKRIAM